LIASTEGPQSTYSVEKLLSHIGRKIRSALEALQFPGSREQLLSTSSALKFFQGAVRHVFWGFSAKVRKRGKIATAPQMSFSTE